MGAFRTLRVHKLLKESGRFLEVDSAPMGGADKDVSRVALGKGSNKREIYEGWQGRSLILS